MTKIEVATDFKSLRKVVLPIFNEDHNRIVGVVPAADQQRELGLLKEPIVLTI